MKTSKGGLAQVEWLECRRLMAAAPSDFTVTVDGKANIYSALLGTPPAPGGGGAGVAAAVVSFAPSDAPRTVTVVSTSGTVSGWAARGNYNGADGGPYWGGITRVPAFGGVSGIVHGSKTMFVTGVFYSSALDSAAAAAPPATPDYTGGDNVSVFRPARRQQVFVGDGRTAAGTRQTFVVPAGADRLALGFAENLGFQHAERRPGYYGDNGGSLTMALRLEDLTTPTPTPTTPTTPTPTVPSVPTRLAATATPVAATASAAGVFLSWVDNSTDETGFVIERADTAGGPWEAITTTAANVTSYTDAGLAAATPYYYRVSAANAAGAGEPTSGVGVITLLPIPAAPTNVVATGNGGGQVDLTWTDNSSTETGFTAERAAGPDGPWVAVGTTAANVTTFSVTGLSPQTTYYFRVSATNGGGDAAAAGPPAAAVTGDPGVPPTPTPGGGTALIVTLGGGGTGGLPTTVVGGSKGLTLVNVGNPTAAAVRVVVTLYASADAAWDDADPALATAVKLVKIPAGVSKAVKLKFVYPPTLPDGVYRLAARAVPTAVDGAGTGAAGTAVGTSVVTVAPPVARLAVGSIRPLPATVAQGRPAAALLTLTNVGNVTLRGAAAVTLRLSVDPTGGAPAGAAQPVATKRLAVKAGATKVLRLRIAVPTSLPAANYYLVAEVVPPPGGFVDPAVVTAVGTEPLIVVAAG